MAIKMRIAAFVSAIVIAFSGAVVTAHEEKSIITDNVVEINETISEEGFVHPGVGFNAESLYTMRDMVKEGVSPWVDYFEGMRRTKYAKKDIELKKQEQIVNNGGINSFAHDAQTAWVHSIMYFVTGDEEYRKLPVEVIKWYGEREDFFPAWFSDSHIKLGKYVHTFCEMAELMRYTTPNDKSLEVTDEMIDAVSENCLKPMSDKCLSQKGYFMNQHNYALQGYLAETVLSDDIARYADAVEMATVNSGYTENPARNGSIKNVFRWVTADEETGEACEPHLQHAEMGRDQDHAKGNTDNYVLISRTTDIQHTKVDPVEGTITDDINGVSVTNFLDDRIIKSGEIFFEYNMGYDLPWTTIYSENNGNDKIAVYRSLSTGYRGRLMSTGTMALYYRYKGLGYDLENDYPMCYAAAMKIKESSKDNVLTGTYIDTVHNYDFDFWTSLDEKAADGSPNPQRAKEALAVDLAEYTVTPSNIIELEDRFIDLMDNGEYAQLEYPKNESDVEIEKKSDSDGTGYAHMELKGSYARTMVVYNADMPKNKLGLRVRTEAAVNLKLYNKSDYADGEMLSVTVPNTENEWRYVIFDFSSGSVRESDRGAIWYLTAQSANGTDTAIDFDKINTNETEIKTVEITSGSNKTAAVAGERLERSYKADGENVTYTANGLPEGAVLDKNTGVFSWTPEKVGAYEFYVTADNGTTVFAKKITVNVCNTFDDAINAVMADCDEDTVYTKLSKSAVDAAKSEAQESKTRESLDKLQDCVNNLEELNPSLRYGGLDFSDIVVCSVGDGIENLVDNKPGSNITMKEPDMNITLDFGNNYRLRADSFEIQPSDGFPARCLDTAIYGSNDGFNWECLTENKAVISDKMQTLTVSADKKDTAYRYIRMYMPNGTNRKNQNAYIMGVGEFRINGERIEEYTPDYHKSFIEGYDNGTFMPDANVTRAEAAVMMSRTLSAYMDNNECINSFADVKDDAWYTKDLAYMAKKSFITGNGEKNFRPDEKITRGEFCDMVVRVKGLKGDGATKFSDIKGTANEKSIALVEASGWIEGYDDGTFRPDEPITRAELTAIINRIEGRTICGDGNEFTDVCETHWAYYDIIEAAHSHYMD